MTEGPVDQHGTADPDNTAPRLPGAVLFMCSMNQVRSPMAAAMARHLYQNKMYVRSAGVERGMNDGFMIQVLTEIGVDVSTHVPKRFGDLGDSNFDLVIALSGKAKRYAMEMTQVMAIEVEHWPLPDPTTVEGTREAILRAYRDVRDDLARRILARFGPPVLSFATEIPPVIERRP